MSPVRERWYARSGWNRCPSLRRSGPATCHTDHCQLAPRLDHWVGPCSCHRITPNDVVRGIGDTVVVVVAGRDHSLVDRDIVDSHPVSNGAQRIRLERVKQADRAKRRVGYKPELVIRAAGYGGGFHCDHIDLRPAIQNPVATGPVDPNNRHRRLLNWGQQ